jgi:hypothetical protein
MAEKLTLKQGEAKTITFTVKDAAGVVVNLSAATLTLGIKKLKTDAAYAISKADTDFSKTLASSGIVSVNLTGTDTNQPEGTYVGELKCAWTGPVVKKSDDFFLQVKQAVTS